MTMARPWEKLNRIAAPIGLAETGKDTAKGGKRLQKKCNGLFKKMKLKRIIEEPGGERKA
jgi:hypothetical protein